MKILKRHYSQHTSDFCCPVRVPAMTWAMTPGLARSCVNNSLLETLGKDSSKSEVGRNPDGASHNNAH